MKKISIALVALVAAATFAVAQTDQHQHDTNARQSAQTQSQHPAQSNLDTTMPAHPANMDHDDMFADGMTHHHREGIRMSEMAVQKAQSAELRAMAQKMIDEQRRDIDEMRSLRGSSPAMGMEMMMSMPGMMPESDMQRDMARLEAATGREFDLVFTEIMPKHHSGAVMMSQHEMEKGDNAGMKAVAARIAETQARERQQLLAMHDTLDDANRAMVSSAQEAGEPAETRARMRKD